MFCTDNVGARQRQIQQRLQLGLRDIFCWPVFKLFRNKRFVSFVIWFILTTFFAIDILTILIMSFVNLFECNKTTQEGSVPPLQFSSPIDANIANEKVRILCLISPKEYDSVSIKKARLIRETWGKRCNKLLFVTNNPLLATKEQNFVVAKTAAGLFELLFNHHFNDFQWFLHADDESYLIIENLKEMLAIYDAYSPYYLGASDGSGSAYVLSKGTVRRLVYQSRRHAPVPECASRRTNHVPSISHSCLDRMGVTRENTLDDRGCERFLNIQLGRKLANSNNELCTSTTVIAFSQLSYNQFSVYEHLLYRLNKL